MRRSRVLALAAVLAAGVSVPAMAAWDYIGSVDFGWRGERATQYGNFGGSVESLNFRAEGSNVSCRSVRASFRRGGSTEIFRGFIRRGRSVNVDLPGRERRIERLDFNCRSDGRRNATIRISADIGRYRGEWRQSSDWGTRWSRMFHWNDDGDGRGDYGRGDYGHGDYGHGDYGHDGDRGDNNQWVRLGSESFEGRGDREVAYAGWAGQSIQTLALKPVNGDARCSRVMATFGNGQTRPLNIDGGDYLRQGSYTRLDLPGGDRDVRRITMMCNPVRDMQVTIELFAQK